MAYERADVNLQHVYQPRNEDNDYAYHPLHVYNKAMPDNSFPQFRVEHIVATNNPGMVEPTYNVIRVFDSSIWILLIWSLFSVTVTYSSICRITRVNIFAPTKKCCTSILKYIRFRANL